MGEWTLNGSPLLEAPEAFGYVYCITNITSGQKYIGKKQFYAFRSKKVPGKRNRKHYTKESNWRNYWSSCEELKEDIKALGEDKFVREVLLVCHTKGELT